MAEPCAAIEPGMLAGTGCPTCSHLVAVHAHPIPVCALCELAERHSVLAPIREFGVIHPGDTLLLSTEQRLTAEQAATIKAAVEDNMHGVTAVVTSGLTVVVQHDAT